MKNVYARLVAPVEQLLDKTTMYRTVLYALLGLVAVSLAFGAIGVIPQTVTEQLLSLAVVMVVCYGVNVVWGRILGVAVNHESAAITALILYFLINPARELAALHIIALAALVAMSSKYLLVYRKQHLVNAAAVGILALSLSGYYDATWWIATSAMFVPLVIAGVAVVSKVRRWVPVSAVVVVGYATFLFEEWRFGSDIVATWSVYFLSYPALFLGFFMLTEPFSMPPTKKLQAGYGALVGFLSSTALLQPLVTMSPELALVVGNLAAYPFTLRRKLLLTLQSKREIASGTWEFSFTKPVGLTFAPGQYLEWMLPHSSADTRGIRRYFTIASAPTEDALRLALKVPVPGSSYKQALSTLPVGGVVIASQLAGDFTLSSNVAQKVGWIAGGIGVTPFRSQLQYLLDTKRTQDTVLFYCNNYSTDAAYTDLWATATAALPFRLVPVFAKEAPAPEYETGYLTADMLSRVCPDVLERTWFVSGPPPMVSATVSTLKSLGVPSGQIVCDFFPGLA